MVRRVFGDQHYVRDGACRVGMLLKGGTPEIFGKVLLTDGKADGGRFGVARKRKRETNLDRRAGRGVVSLEAPRRFDTSMAAT